MILIKIVIAGIIPNKPATVRKGIEWGKRVAADRLHEKEDSSDKLGKWRNL